MPECPPFRKAGPRDKPFRSANSGEDAANGWRRPAGWLGLPPQGHVLTHIVKLNRLGILVGVRIGVFLVRLQETPNLRYHASP